MYKTIIKVTFEKLFSKWQVLLKALFLPLLFLLFMEYVGVNVLIQKDSSAIGVLILTVISLIINVFIAVTTHRVLLLGDDSVPPYGIFTLGARERKFFLKSIILALIVILPMSIATFIHPILGVIAIISGLIIFSRLSLVFPAVCIDEEISFGDAWNLTKEYKGLVFLTLIVFPAILSILVALIYGLVIGFLVKVIAPELSILSAFLNLFITVFVIGFLSSTYMYIRTERADFFDKDENETPARDIIQSQNEQTNKINIDIKHNVSFESLKAELKAQYEPLGFTKNSFDKENSWMIKNPELGSSYVHLSLINDEYVIETYNIQSPDLKIMNNS